MTTTYKDDNIPPKPPAFIKGFSNSLQKFENSNLNEIIVRAMTHESVDEKFRWGSDVLPSNIWINDMSGHGGSKTYMVKVSGKDYAHIVFHSRTQLKFVNDALGENRLRDGTG